MLFKIAQDKLEPQAFKDLSVFGQAEKDLENLMADNLFEVLFEGAPLMTITQERRRQPEPDIVAMDAQGNMVVFELKLGAASKGALDQLFRYVDDVRRWSYTEIQEKLNVYRAKRKEPLVVDLGTHHKEAFDLPQALLSNGFNQQQRMVVVGRSADEDLIGSIDYWRAKGLDIDFIPYRVFTIGTEHYLDFFAKPYDLRSNPGERKGVLFDTNLSYSASSFGDMVNNNKVSAYGSVKHYVGYLKKGDTVFYSHKGYGIVGAARVTSSKPTPLPPEELYQTVEFLTAKPKDLQNPKAMSFGELTRLLDKGFYWARTIKHPYLKPDETEKLLAALVKKLGAP